MHSELSWDGSCDFLLSVSNEDKAVQTEAYITTEVKELLEDHIRYHREMKAHLEKALTVARREWRRGMKELLSHGPKKPPKSLSSILKESPKPVTVENLQNFFLKKRVLGSLPAVSTLSVSNDCPKDWSTMADKIKATEEQARRQQTKTLEVNVTLGYLLEEGFKLYEERQIIDRTEGTFESWLHKTVGLSSRYARKLRAIARLLRPYPGLCRLSMSIAETYRRLPDLKKVLEVPEYRAIWLA